MHAPSYSSDTKYIYIYILYFFFCNCCGSLVFLFSLLLVYLFLRFFSFLFFCYGPKFWFLFIDYVHSFIITRNTTFFRSRSLFFLVLLVIFFSSSYTHSSIAFLTPLPTVAKGWFALMVATFPWLE